MRVKDAVGRWGEQVAADHLAAAGMTIIARNWRCRRGEIDIVAHDGQDVVFVEVKTRSSTAFGQPSEAVTHDKIARIRVLSLQWLQENRNGHMFRAGIRFDVVSVVRGQGNGPAVVQHVRGAF